ncbi:MAG: response regulator transcription factor [Opitutaceae bacterium]|nr:response regulator transcription factor [Opitutaceae bacterium]
MPVRLILVDDHQLLRDGLRLRLRFEPDFEVVGDAGALVEAYRLIETTRPDVVVLDLNLPGESGLEAIARIRHTWPGTRVLVITGTTDPGAAREVARAGAEGFVRKEDAIEELPRAIRAVMAGKTYLSPEAAAAVAQALREDPPAGPKDAVAHGLSARELEVLRGIGEGITYKEIATRLSLSVKSIETYRARLTRKLGCTSKVELAHHAARLGLVKR